MLKNIHRYVYRKLCYLKTLIAIIKSIKRKTNYVVPAFETFKKNTRKVDCRYRNHFLRR